MNLQQHVGSDHRDLINDEQLQIRQLCSKGVELVLSERLDGKFGSAK